MNEKDLLRLEFDLYSRHHIITQAVRALAGDKPLHVVDAGGRSGLIQTFMPEQDLTVVDIREPETESDKALKQQGKYVIGSVLKMPLPDRSVDLALSLEMLEHMTAEERPQALREMLRVSRMGIIFSFPQDSAANDQAERLVNNYYKRLTGEEHPWLKEHIEHRPLPQPEQLEAALHELGLHFVRLSSSNTYLWTLMRYYIFSTHGFHVDLESMFEFYNQHIAQVADAVGPSYRAIYVAVRPEFAELLTRLPKQAAKQTPMPAEIMLLLDKVFDAVANQSEQKTQHIQNLETSAQAKDARISLLEEHVGTKEAHINNLEKQSEAKDARIFVLEGEMQAKTTHITNLETQAEAKDLHVDDLEQQVKAKDVHIQNVEATQKNNEIIQQKNARIQQSQKALIATLQQEIQNKDKQVSGLESELTQVKVHLEQQKKNVQRQAEEHQTLHNEYSTAVQDYEQRLGERQDRLDDLEIQLKQHTQIVQHLEGVIQAKDTHIRNIQPSFDEMQSFRKYFFMRWMFKAAHSLGAKALHTRERVHHLKLAAQILRKQGMGEFVKSLKRYADGTSIVQNPLPASSLTLNEQYKLLRGGQLITKTQLRQQTEEVKSWPHTPLVSVVVAAYYVEPKWLDRCVESIHEQTYGNLEIVVAVHPELEAGAVSLLHKWSKKDQRVRLVTPEQLHGATSLWNAGLQAAKGEYVLLVTGDDELPAQALYALVQPTQADQPIDVVYGDEDMVQTDGTLIHPHFKSDFNPDLLLSMNYFGHPVMFRRRLAQTSGWLREKMDGAQDYDLWLRLMEQTKHITHVSQVLYHQRVSTQALAETFEKRTTQDVASMQALEDYAARKKIQATVSPGLAEHTYRFQRAILGKPLVSIIIPFRDKVELLKLCVPSILSKTDYPNFEILLISNNSTRRDTAQYVAELVAQDKRIRTFEFNVPFNYAQINNWAVEQAKGEYILLLNNDIEVISSEWLSALLEQAQRPEVGAVGAQLLYPNYTIQHAGVILGIGGAAGHNHKYFPADLTGYFARLSSIQNFSAVTGACLLTKKNLFKQVNGLNEKELAISLNDVDYCLKLRQAGYLVTYTPYAKLYHHESVSRGFEDTPEKQQRFAREFAYFQKTWGPLLQRDPYYNPNLTLKSENFSLNVL